jgi:protein involved in polysaccharide export with SLBB domain
MRKIVSIGIVILWTMLAGVSSAQVSNFPAPPPLPTPVRSTPPEQNPNNPAAMPATPTAPTAPNPSAGDQGTLSIPPDVSPVPTPPPDTSGASLANSIPISAQTLSNMSALDDKNSLHPGDRISFRVVEDRDPAQPRIVTDTGEVDFPYVGRLKVEGLTCRQVAVQLKKLLEVDYYKSATVIVGLDVIASHQAEQAMLPHNVAWVMGQVRSVGPVEISPLQPVTVSQAILRAGGFGDFADQRKVRVIHRSSPTSSATAAPTAEINDDGKGTIVDVKAIFSGDKVPDPVVQANDYIVVPKKFINL